MFRKVGVVVVVAVVAAALLPVGSPIQISYVYSDSMEPTIGQNDGYVLVPAGTVEVGDIVTFYSATHDEYVTHRIVGRSESEFITQGDNNPTTDQAGGYPSVSRDSIRGRVLTYDGRPVVFPGFGHAVSFLQTNQLWVLGGAGLVLGWITLRPASGRPIPTSQSVLRVRDVMHPLFAASVVIVVGLLVLGGTTHTLSYVAVEGGSGGLPNTVRVGEPSVDTLVATTTATPTTYRIVGADGVRITNQTRNASAIEMTVLVPPSSERGEYTATVTVSRYPRLLPREILRALHRVHPLAAALGVTTVGLSPFYLVYALFVDGRTPIRSRTSTRDRPSGGFR